jgi:predicted AlkP superfamily pyrophosphatase or phosphodiesterase
MLSTPVKHLSRLLVCSLFAALPVFAGPAEHVVLVSIDGFRPDFYVEQDWPMPMVRQMAREGVHAEGVRGVFPTVTYPSHTTLVTGAFPAQHGVPYNNPFEPEGQTGKWYWSYSAIEVPTLWQAVRAAGGTTAAVSWPVTDGAPIDLVVPEVWSLDPESDRLGPMKQGSTPGLWEELEREATGRIGARNFSADWMTRDDVTGAAAAYLLEVHKPSLLAVHLIASDHFQHLDGRRSDRVLRALSAADRAISAMVEAAERAGILDSTAFVITGDHGFVNVQTTVAPNVWLAEAGLIEAAPDRGDWRAAFHTQGGAAFLHLRRDGDERSLREVRRALESLPTRTQRLFRVVERDELAAVGADPAAQLALAAFLGVAFDARADGEAVAAGSGGTHGYFPSDFPQIHTGFVAWGAGLAEGVVGHLIGLEDVAPLIAELLGLDFEAPKGTAPLGFLRRP